MGGEHRWVVDISGWRTQVGGGYTEMVEFKVDGENLSAWWILKWVVDTGKWWNFRWVENNKLGGEYQAGWRNQAGW